MLQHLLEERLPWLSLITARQIGIRLEELVQMELIDESSHAELVQAGLLVKRVGLPFLKDAPTVA